MRKPINFLDLKRRSLDFFEFLETKKLDPDCESQAEVRNWYYNLYKPHIKRTDPGSQHYSFSMIVRELMYLRKLYKQRDEDDGEVYFRTPQNRFRKPKTVLDQHLSYKRNKKSISDITTPYERTAGATVAASVKDEKIKCALCRTDGLSKEEFEKHCKSAKHLIALNLEELTKQKSNESVQVSSKDCVEIDGVLSFGMKPKSSKTIKLTVSNHTNQSVILKSCQLFKPDEVFTLQLADERARKEIPKDGDYEIRLSAEMNQVGVRQNKIVLKLDFGASNVPGTVTKDIRANAGDDVTESLKAKAPYHHPPVKAVSRTNMQIIPGIPLERDEDDGYNLEREIGLRDCPIPKYIDIISKTGIDPNHAKDEETKLLIEGKIELFSSPVTAENYKERFDDLLFFEELQMEVDIRKYEMRNAEMKKYNEDRRKLVLKVPGLAENRPSVLRGDRILVRKELGDELLERKQYEGIVHRVLEKEVVLGFAESFVSNFIDKMKFQVSFVFNRYPMKLMHRACELVKETAIHSILFPKKAIPNPTAAPRLRLFNRQQEENTEQRLAIENIVHGSSFPFPYVVFGPPGTGKTVTIVEAMKQIHKTKPTNRILACAPSNSAADLITQRLIEHIPKNQVFRLFASSRSYDLIPENIKECSNCRGRDRFFFPKKAEFQKYRIVIITLVSAGRIASANFESNFFTHVFLDECGHAMEPESVISLAGIITANRTQVVVAGDHKQLGPVIRSPYSKQFGLGISLLERLMTEDLYKRQKTGFDTRFVTKLLKNYRSHKDILEVPNRLFYEKELQSCADTVMTQSMLSWEGLPKQHFPFVFHGVVGKEQQEEKSPSFFNAEEVSIVIKYVESLKAHKGYRLRNSDIGIISPYRQQVYKIKKTLEKKNISGITVGSVEEFQGQERHVIIISTVRSKPDYYDHDMKFNLGFLRNEKRFNVAVTRPRALLIVVGNPFSLAQDIFWRELLSFARTKGGYTGVKFDPEEVILEKIMERLESLNLGGGTCVSDHSLQNESEPMRWDI